MSFLNQATENQRTRDELSSEPDIQPIYQIKSERVMFELGPLKTYQNSLGNAWIVGSSTNGIVGTNTGTVGGGQQVVGGSGRTITVVSISNVDNIFVERFNFNTFEGGSTTADWAVTNGELNFTTGEVAVSDSVALNTGTITESTIIATLSSGSLTDLSFELSADGGTNWESVTHAAAHSFTNTGTDLMFKITSTGTVTITKIEIRYN